MIRVGYAKQLVHEHRFELLERDRGSEVYRRAGQFLVRRGCYPEEKWTAKYGGSGTAAVWVGPEFDDPITALVHADIAEWGAEWPRQ